MLHPRLSLLGRNLPIYDQISLLKDATLDICQIQFNTVFNEKDKAWECGHHCYTIQDGALGEPGTPKVGRDGAGQHGHCGVLLPPMAVPETWVRPVNMESPAVSCSGRSPQSPSAGP